MIAINILVLNSGSSSLKYQLIDMNDEKILAKGICEKIGSSESEVHQITHLGKKIDKIVIPGISNHTKAFKYIEEMLMDSKKGIIKDI